MLYMLSAIGLALLFTLLFLINWDKIKKVFIPTETCVIKYQQTIKGERSMEMELENLLNAYLRDFDRKKDLRVVVPNSIPIVWFGDMEAYQKSPVKIVTIGLNPSLNEFKKPRFDTHANSADAIYKTLCNYFYNNPYKIWFAQFEKCLKRIDASYGGKMSVTVQPNTAIHIDAYSSIATAPTWSRLSQNQKDSVNQQDMCQLLLEYLQPDVVLMSTAHNVFEETLHITRRPIKYYDYNGKRAVEVYKEHGQILVWGQHALGASFGCIPNELLDKAFEAIRTELIRNDTIRN